MCSACIQYWLVRQVKTVQPGFRRTYTYLLTYLLTYLDLKPLHIERQNFRVNLYGEYLEQVRK